jgi:hypothetical protein
MLRIVLIFFLIFIGRVCLAATIDDGKREFEAKNYSEALTILLPLANGGDSDSQRMIGEMSYNGWGMKINYVAAFKWNELAANGNDPVAMYNLGYIYEHGKGVAKSIKDAQDWYLKSASRGYAQAQYKMGQLLEATDRNRADYWYEKAYQQGHPLAKERYAALNNAIVADQQAEEARQKAEERAERYREDHDPEIIAQRAEERREKAEQEQRERSEKEQERSEKEQNFQNTLNMIQQAGNNISSSIAQTSAQNTALIAEAQAEKRRQQEEARERQREQQQAYQQQQQQRQQPIQVAQAPQPITPTPPPPSSTGYGSNQSGSSNYGGSTAGSSNNSGGGNAGNTNQPSSPSNSGPQYVTPIPAICVAMSYPNNGELMLTNNCGVAVHVGWGNGRQGCWGSGDIDAGATLGTGQTASSVKSCGGVTVSVCPAGSGAVVPTGNGFWGYDTLGGYYCKVQ